MSDQQENQTLPEENRPPETPENGFVLPNKEDKPRIQAPNSEKDYQLTSRDLEVDGKKYKITPKFELFCRLYNDPDSETYGNATKCAIVAYKLDPKTQYGVAARIGHDNVYKHKDIARDYLQRKGYTFQRHLDVAIKRTLETDNVQWWDRAGMLAGYHEMAEEQEKASVTNNTQVNVFNMEQDTKRDWNQEFKDFLEEKSRKDP